jgi:hypothetical protein
VNEYGMDLRIEALEVQVKEMAARLHEIERVIEAMLRVCNCPACRRRRAELAGRDEAPPATVRLATRVRNSLLRGS